MIIGKNKSISNLCAFVPNVADINNIQLIDNEWRELLDFDFNEHNLVEEQDIEKCWYTIFRVRRCDGSEVFPHLKKLSLSNFNCTYFYSQYRTNIFTNKFK